MMQSDTVTWGAAILLSLLVHGMMFMQSGARMGAENAPEMQTTQVTRLNFNQSSKQPVMDEPRLIKDPVISPVKKVEPKPVLAKQKIEHNSRAVEQLNSPPGVKGEQVSDSSDGLLQRERQQYLYELLSHIESHKFYPRAARRRYLEGKVNISFMLRDDGDYEQLMLEGEQSILVEAARNALQSAIPLPVPPEDIGLSRQIEFNMVYSLAD